MKRRRPHLWQCPLSTRSGHSAQAYAAWMQADEPQRPNSVAAFETLSLLSLAIDLILVSGFTWADLLWIPLMLWAVLSITRRRSSVARWVFTALYGLGFVIVAYLLATGLAKLSEVEWTGWLLSGLAIAQLALLWARTTSDWVSPRGIQSPQPETAA